MIAPCCFPPIHTLEHLEERKANHGDARKSTSVRLKKVTKDLLFQEELRGYKLIKEGPDCLEGRSMPTKPQEVEPTIERDAECEPGRSPIEEHNLRPQAGNTITANKVDQDGSRSFPSSCRATEAKVDVGKDEQAWFEDWWMPPVKMTEPP
ncbi:hypothetical protein NDU88_002529 [Pleurodeles waltl]|uniref:Prolactin receptor n=1 Tax=Pleurodeles waltl TaxID=8319 RepID=A0AAV7WNR7_PLEWA|nr:hypothetical protein NDU88_002529 [Pleurodeles waltl]